METSEYEVLANVETCHWWHTGMRAIAAALIHRKYAKRHDLDILDAGCGTGGDTALLRRYGRVVGIDLAADAIRLNQHTPMLARGSVLSLPFADDSFDLVASFDVLYHRQVPNERVALGEIRRVLRPGGRLLLRLPAYEFLRSKHDRAVHTRRRYTAAKVEAFLADAGFYIERCTYINTLLFPIPLVQRLLERLIPALEHADSDLALPSPLINTLLSTVLLSEAAWIRMHGSFPFGLSILCFAHCGKIEVVPTISRITPSQPRREADTKFG